MKKLTASIFASLLTVVTVGAANANIASQGYVDEKVGTVTTALGNKADKTELGKYATTEALTSGLAGKLDTTGTAAKAIADAAGNVITDTYATKEEIADLATDENLALKQDKTDEGLETTNKTVVGAINEVRVTANTASSTASAAQSAAEAAQTAADSKLPTATYNSQVGTVSATNMGTTATTVVTAIKEVASKAAAAQTTATAAQGAAGTAQAAAEAAQGDVDALEVRVGTAETDIDGIQGQLENMATSETVSGLQTEVAGLKTSKLDKATYDSQVGTVSAADMGTTATTVVTAIKEVAGEAEAAQSAASAADSKAQAAQSAAEAADSKAQAAQTTANAAIPKPDGECSDPTNKCVLTFNNSVYAWEVIARETSDQ